MHSSCAHVGASLLDSDSVFNTLQFLIKNYLRQSSLQTCALLPGDQSVSLNGTKQLDRLLKKKVQFISIQQNILK